jgi:branched-subunit amino acid transport protein
MTIWLTMIAAGLITYAYRLSFIQLLSRRKVPETLQRALRLVPPAVLTAIIFPELLLHDGSLNVGLHNFRLIAGIIAILVAWRTKNVVLTILVGMAALLLMQWIF